MGIKVEKINHMVDAETIDKISDNPAHHEPHSDLAEGAMNFKMTSVVEEGDDRNQSDTG